jgi:hypothetical protein
MIKRIMMVVIAITITIPLLPLQTSADGIVQQYLLESDPGNHLTDSFWCQAQNKNLSWPTAIGTCNTGGGAIQGFDKTNWSYVILRNVDPGNTPNPNYTSSNGQPQYLHKNVFTIIVASPNHKLTFYKNSTDNQYYITSDAVMTKAFIQAEPNSDPDYKYNWTGAYSLDQYQTGVQGYFDPTVIPNFKGFVIGNDIYSGQVGTNNVTYASSWDMGQFTSHVPYGDDGASSCGTLDIGCWIGKLTQGFTDGVKALFGLLVDGFKWLFIPDSGSINDEWNGLNSFLQQHLGFLVYPFTFVGNFFSAFTSNDSWCSSTSCSKDFGTLYGHHFNVNLGQMQSTMPTVWAWFSGMLRGLVILALLLAVRQKYRQVTSR